MSKVSVIIPVYNNEAFIEKCMKSVMEQTYKCLEIIVINDGSTDESGTIIRKLGMEDKRIRLVEQKNSGVAAARNYGLEIATGEYLTFVDGDDYISPGYIENLYNDAKRKNTDMLICGLTYVDECDNVLKQLVPGEYRRYEKEEWTFRISAVCSHFYRRELWERYHVRFCPGARGEDMPISLFFSAVCDKIDVSKENGYFYVQHATSAMHNFRGLRNYNLPYQALEETLQKVKKIGMKNSPAYYELFAMRILCTCLFELGRGASRDKMKELCDYIVRILHTYFPNYYKNKLLWLGSSIEAPFIQKAAVWVLMILVKTRLLYPVASVLLCRGEK